MIREHVPLSPLSTFEVGGPARFYAEAPDEAAVVSALKWARDRETKVFMLGGGSNLLIADRGIDALVLRITSRGFVREEKNGAAYVHAAAGEPWDSVVSRSVSEGLAGLECLSGIPGDTGAAPIQNIGAYGQDVSETIVSVRAVDRTTGHIVELRAGDCQFGYRDSVFKRGARDRFAVTRVTFALRKDGAPTLRYAELARAFHASAPDGRSPTLAEARALVLKLRHGKSMVIDAADENRRSAGSFFMNPVLLPERLAPALARIKSAAELQSGEKIPMFPADHGATKLSAAWLIERAGFRKGAREGNVGLSTRHALALVNWGGATARELTAWAARIRAAVFERFGISLEPEPVLAGFSDEEIQALTGPLGPP